MSDLPAPPELSAVPEAAWAEARRCFTVIQKLANMQRRTRAQVIAAAAELGFSCTQVYDRLNRFLADPRLTSLLPRPADIAAAARECQDVTLLINDAGIYRRVRLFDATSMESVRAVWETNFLRPLALSRAFAPMLAATAAGQSSMCARHSVGAACRRPDGRSSRR